MNHEAEKKIAHARLEILRLKDANARHAPDSDSLALALEVPSPSLIGASRVHKLYCSRASGHRHARLVMRGRMTAERLQDK